MIQVNVDVVSLYCTVRDRQNALVRSLAKNDFEVTEDGNAQTIKYFSRETDVPLTVGVLVDVSGSQKKLIEIERQAASKFFTSVLTPKDAGFLISFGATFDLLQDVTGAPEVLQQGLARMKLNSGLPGPASGPGTVLYDAVYFAAHTVLGTEHGRRAMILITDGQDNGSRLGMKDAIEAAQKSDAIIYGILYVDSQSYLLPAMLPGGGSAGYKGEGILKQMAEETGGRLFAVGGKNTLDAIFGQIQEEMRTQYLIGYTPTSSNKDGSFRKIDLKTHDKDFKVQVRKGYYAMPNAR